MGPLSPGHGRYSHGLLVHHDDEELVEGTRDFVEQGLASGAHVLVHSTQNKVRMLRDELGTRPRLEYGFDEELYQAPMKTLFGYQQKLAEIPEGTELWVTGTVPLGRDAAERAAWARYESAVNEALSSFPFRALCTYDARKVTLSVIVAARATHPTIADNLTSRRSPDYVDPASFLGHPLAQIPQPPHSPPDVALTLSRLEDLAGARYRLKVTARAHSALPKGSIQELLMAANEVAANGLVHGAPPVHIALWAEAAALTCEVVDSGPGGLDPVAGYRYPDETSPIGLWAARQLVDDIFISTPAAGGCKVLLTKT